MANFALAALSATTQIMAGNAANQQAKINAGMYEQQAGFINTQIGLENELSDIQRDISLTEYRRAKSRMASSVTATAARSGVEMSGTPMAIMIENLTQMGIDEAITKFNYATKKASNEYNLKQQQIGMLSQASQTRYAGKIAKNQAYSNAFSTALQGAYTSASRMGSVSKTSGIGSSKGLYSYSKNIGGGNVFKYI